MKPSSIAAFTFLLVWSFSDRAAAQDQEIKFPAQYKRVHQEILMDVFSDKVEEAVRALEEHIRQNPKDAESYYMLAVANAQRGRIDDAIANMTAALELGLPPGRFVGGTRTGLEPIRSRLEYQLIANTLQNTPIHGPMLGAMTDRGVQVWVRTAGEATVRVVASKTDDFTNPIESEPAPSSLESDFTAVAKLVGLEPATEYYYRVSVSAAPPLGETYRFRTFPKPAAAAKFRIVFGGGAGYVPPNERMWDTIRSFEPDALFLLGDNVYSDRPESPEMQHFCYYRRQSRPEFRRLVSRVPVFAIWDDHDFGTNDCAHGSDPDSPPWKRPVMQVFRNNWVNPYFGGGDANPGCYFDFQIADVHFVLLDGRYYRSKRNEADPSMLGAVQKGWLLDQIDRAAATFEVLCSPVPWTFVAKGESKDTWNGFQDERTEIFDRLTRNRVDGVVLVSADRHRSDLWKIARENDYTLYEFNSSMLTNQGRAATMKHAEFSYNDKQTFGMIDFDTTAADPTVTYTVVTIDGEEIFSFPLSRSQLSSR